MQQIQILGNGIMQPIRVLLDDIDITRYVSKVTIAFEPGMPPVVELVYYGQVIIEDEQIATVIGKIETLEDKDGNEMP